MDLEQVSSAGALTLLTVVDARNHMRITTTSMDAQIQAVVEEATAVIAERCRRSIVSTVWRYRLPSFPKGGLSLPRPDFVSLSSVTYLKASDGASTTVAAGDMLISREDPFFASISHKTGWPDTKEDPRAVTIEFTEAMTPVPLSVKRAVKLLADHYRRQTSAVLTDSRYTVFSREIPFGIEYILRPHIIPLAYGE